MPRVGWLALGGLGAALLTGAAGQSFEWILTLGILLATALALSVALHTGHRSVAVMAVGAGSIALRVAIGTAVSPAFADPGPPPTTNAAWVAQIERLGSTQGGMQRALIDVTLDAKDKTDASIDPVGDRSAAPDPAAGVSWVVYAFLPRYPVVAPGDRVSFVARLELPPDGPGFGDVLAAQGAAASVRVRDMQLLPRGGDPLAALETLRRTGGELLARTLPQPQAGLAAGILIGLRDLVDRDLAADFTTAGLSHIVAISGWNIAVVGAVMVSLLRWLPRRARSIVVLVAIVIYRSWQVPERAWSVPPSWVAWSSSCANRAGAVGPLRRSASRSGSCCLQIRGSYRTSGSSCRSRQPPGSGWGPALQQRISGRAPRRAPGWLVESTAVSLAAQAATLPLILLHFGRLSLVSPLANLLAAPFIAPSMLAALVALLAGVGAELGAAQVLLIPAEVLGNLGLAALVIVARLSASLPLASLSLQPPFDLLTAALSAIGVAVFGTAAGRRFRFLFPWRRGRQEDGGGRRASAPASRERPPPRGRTSAHEPTGGGHTAGRPRLGRGVRAMSAVAAALLVVAVAVAASRSDGRFRMTVLDIGQGDAILLEGSRGARMLIDGGPDPDLLLSRLDEHIPAWDRRLDLLVLSHPHEDHVGGMALLLSRYRVGAIAETGMIGNGPGDHAFRAELGQLGVGTVLLAAGDSVQLDNAALDVLWPRRGEVPLHPSNDGSAVNNVSIVFDVRLAHRRMLLTGDIQEDIDPQLLAAGIGQPGEPPVDVLKVAHHGSRTATTTALLSALHPSVALISAGLGNPYGHPSPDTIDRLEAMGAQVLRTDLDGNLTVTSDGSDLHVSTSGGRTTADSEPNPLVAQASIAPPQAGHAPALPVAARRSSPVAPASASSASAASAASSIPTVAGFACAITPRGTAATPIGSPARMRGPVAQPVGGARRILDVASDRGTSVRAPGLALAPRIAGGNGSTQRPPGLPPLPVERLTSCYDRSDDRPVPRRSLRAAARTQAVAPSREARHGGRGDCRVPGLANRGSRHPDRPPPGGERGPPP